jgi:hypothetical protein
MAVADNIRPLAVHASRPFIGPRNFPGSDSVLSRALAAAVAESMAVPGAGANASRYVCISATDDVYVNVVGTAAVPGDVTDGTASVLLSKYKGEHWFACSGVTTISVICAGAAVVTASFYRD